MKLRFIWVVPPNVLFFLSKCCQTDYRQINLIFDGKLYFEQGFDTYLYRVFDARKGRVTEFQIQTRLWTGCFKEFQIYTFLVMNKIRIGVVTQCKRELHLMYSNLSNPKAEIIIVLFSVLLPKVWNMFSLSMFNVNMTNFRLLRELLWEL